MTSLAYEQPDGLPDPNAFLAGQKNFAVNEIEVFRISPKTSTLQYKPEDERAHEEVMPGWYLTARLARSMEGDLVQAILQEDEQGGK